MILDSNIIIYSAQPQYQQIRELIKRASPAVSAISYVEVLGFTQITQAQVVHFNEFFSRAHVYAMDRPILDQAVALRQLRRMSLGDAIIAATALVHNKTLVTRNTSDFRWIAALRLFDPLSATP